MLGVVAPFLIYFAALAGTCDFAPDPRSPSFDKYSVKLMSSLINIAGKYVGNTMILSSEDFDRVEWMKCFVNNVNISVKIISGGDDVEIAEEKGLRVIFVDNSYLLRNRLGDEEMVSLTWSEKNFLLVMGKNFSHDGMHQIFHHFWRMKRANVVALKMNGKNEAVIYDDYNAYHKYGCDFRLRELDASNWYDKSAGFGKGSNSLSPSHRFKNLGGCKLVCAGNDHPPDNELRFDERRKKWIISGVGYEMLKAAGRAMNFHCKIVSPPSSGHARGTQHYISQELKIINEWLMRDFADVAFGWFSYGYFSHNSGSSLGYFSSIDCFGWAVPYLAGAKPPHWLKFTHEFQGNVWAAIGLVFVSITAYFKCTQPDKSASTAVVYATCVFLEQPYHWKRCRLNAFFHASCWIVFILPIAYKASFASFITIPSYGEELESVRDVARSNLRIYASNETLHMLNDKLFHHMEGRFVESDDLSLKHALKRLVEKRDLAVLEVKRYMYYTSLAIKTDKTDTGVKIPFRFIPGCMLRAHTTQFLFKKNHPLASDLDQMASHLLESGLVDHWILHLGKNTKYPVDRIKLRRLQLEALTVPFAILVFGCCASFIIFIGEFLYYACADDNRF